MKLLSWNVNGIRSVFGKGFDRWFEQQEADVVCLQEVKAQPEQLAEHMVHPNGYHSVWHSARRRGYSGVVTFSRKEPLSITHGIGEPAFDSEGRVLITEYRDFVLVNAYFPNSQRDHARLPFKLEFCRRMMETLEGFRKKGRPVLLCGDFNIAHREIDLRNPRINLNNAGFLPEERAWFDSLVASGYLDIFRLFNQEPGHYTWWSYRPTIRQRNIGWRLDCFVCNPEFEDRLKHMSHQPQTPGSDHCPIELHLR